MGAIDKNVPALVPGENFALPDAPQPAVDAAAQKMREDALPSVVRILNPNDKSSGTAFFLDSSGTLATDAHVVLNSSELFARRSDGKHVKVEIVDLDDTRDVALLKTVGNANARPIALGSSDELKPGEKLVGLGHPLSSNENYVIPATYRRQSNVLEAGTGAISATAKEKLTQYLNSDAAPAKLKTFFRRPLLETDAHTEHGTSGGPLLNANREAVGLVEMHTNNRIAYFNRIEAIKELRDGARRFTPLYKDEGEPWAEARREQWKTQSAVDVGRDILRSVYQTAVELQSFKESDPWSGLASVLNGTKPDPDDLISGTRSSIYLRHDLEALQTRADTVDRIKYGLQSAGDLAAVAGSIKSNGLGKQLDGTALLAAGAAMRFGAGFIRSRHVLKSLTATDDGMPPNHFLNDGLKKEL